MPTIQKKMINIVEISPEELGEVFANMDSNEQARFFNEFGKEVKTWSGSFEEQFLSIMNSNELNKNGRSILTKIKGVLNGQ